MALKKDKWVCEACGKVAGRRLIPKHRVERYCPHCEKLTPQVAGNDQAADTMAHCRAMFNL